MDVILATKNCDKVREIREILPDSRIRFMTMTEAGCDAEIIEDGDSFQANALIKARAVHQLTGGYVLADDSGLAVDLLDGAPGIFSARFAGEQASYPEKIARLHDLLATWPPEQWDASFICAMALIRPDGEERVFTGECRGRIATEPRGENGFGYDPVFLLPERGLTTAELSNEEKHSISHRGQALRAVASELLRDLALYEKN
ncbi:MAG TPA: non-canonical purine NTP pyrophosphatase, RdgB/HAM1 family [Clostridiales bacterium]|nr:non-canonical purine NTP pyrophosphatase, RdgB/HAM1 family [Clostridiales bacterium]